MLARGRVEFADILRQIPAIGKPGTIDLDSKRAGGNGLCRIPCDVPESRVMAAGEVDAGNLEIAAVDVTLVKHDAAVVCYLLVRAAPHGIILTFDHGASFGFGEAHGAVLCIVKTDQIPVSVLMSV